MEVNMELGFDPNELKETLMNVNDPNRLISELERLIDLSSELDRINVQGKNFRRVILPRGRPIAVDYIDNTELMLFILDKMVCGNLYSPLRPGKIYIAGTSKDGFYYVTIKPDGRWNIRVPNPSVENMSGIHLYIRVLEDRIIMTNTGTTPVNVIETTYGYRSNVLV